ncbi:MAG TPA: bifunctional diaminohydroxyphosphoribosylaminopyrimidine deaminase/5-amino-6-(5-phosphoribosylamino)uracil reductase RibD [Thermodesulfovibrionales bacterium]|nr:bifunctional diaminohydroxyphosphoribosylaminopyrimidine deaminase/5-amino-6-(5-phosphoribosylamino)uracil reductase RibD [Thermodesulfovibrionales bacterium]
MTDLFFMKRAITLSSKARGMTSPNPMVGAVIVKNGKIVAEGYHRKPGTPHAEAIAIAAAGEKTRGSTLYVSLEPCCHTDKRTPPCTKAIIESGIKRVVMAMKDPNPKVSGKGMKELEEAGIGVTSGLLEEKAKRINEFYIKYITTKKPFVILKVAMTLDGKIATGAGQSKWITGERSRKMVHRLRSSVDAVMTAIGTVKADDPQLTARIRNGRNPKRILIDPYLEISPDAKILRVPPETIVVTEHTSDAAIRRKANILLDNGVSIILYKVSLKLLWLLEKLGERGITSLMIEGGSSLNAHCLEEGIVDKVMLFVAPKIMGGVHSYPAVGGSASRRLTETYMLKDMAARKVGEDLLVEGYLSSTSTAP